MKLCLAASAQGYGGMIPHIGRAGICIWAEITKCDQWLAVGEIFERHA